MDDRSKLIALGNQVIDSGNPRDKTILGTNLLEGLTHLPPNISDYSKSDNSKSNSNLDYKDTNPLHANCSLEHFKIFFTQFLICLNISFKVYDAILAKRMLEGARFGLSKVVSRGQIILQLKNLYLQEITSIRKGLKKNLFVLTMDKWKASNDQKLSGVTVHFINKSVVLKSYHIGLEHIPRKNGFAEYSVQILINMVRYYHIEGRIISITRDNASLVLVINDNGLYKARLVALGNYQKNGLDYDVTFEPVIIYTNLKIVLAVATKFKILVRQKDLSTAFLHAKLDEEIYMRQPEGYAFPGKEKYVLKLKKSLYGLKQAPEAWHKTAEKVILMLGLG